MPTIVSRLLARPLARPLVLVVALAGLLAAPAARAQLAPRVATLRDGAGQAAPQPALDPIAALRQHPAAARTPVATLSYPYGITVDASSNIYVTNLFGGVNIYNSKLQKTGAITAGLLYPAAVAVAFDGTIYVANNGASTITVYNPLLTQIGTITDSTLAGPMSMFIDAEDTAWVLDAGGTLHAYLNDGTALPTTHTGGNAVGPWGPNVTVWGIANANGGYDEAYENRALATHDGPALSNVYPNGSPYAAAEAQDQLGQEYVADLRNDLIQIWSRDGKYEVGQIRTPAAPYGVAVDTRLNRVYAVLTISNEVYVYSTKSPYNLLGIMH